MDPKSLSADFRDFLKCLNDHGVEYLLVGGHAVAYHGYVRPTQDMDVWIAVRRDNAQRMVAAIEAFFGCKLKGLAADWFLDTEQITRFGVRPNLIEIFTKIDGREFRPAYSRRIVGGAAGWTCIQLAARTASLAGLPLPRTTTSLKTSLARWTFPKSWCRTSSRPLRPRVTSGEELETTIKV